MQEDNLKEKGIQAFIWDFFGKIITHGMGLIVSVFLARLLEPSDFGLIAMVMVIVGIAKVFTDVGLGAALIQRKKVLLVHYSSVFYFNVFVGLILTLITYFSAGWIAYFYNNQELMPLVQVISLSFTINAFSSVQTTKLRKELKYAVLTKIGFIASLISGGIGIFLAFHGAGVWSLVAQTLSMEVIYNILIWFLSKWSPSLLFSWKALTQLWGFGFRLFAAGMLDAIYIRMDYLIIGKIFEPATLGFFQRAKSLNRMAVTYSSGSLMSVLFPMLTKIQKDLPRFQKVVIKGLKLISFITVLLFGGLYLIAEELIVILFSEKWLLSVEYFKLLALSGFAYPVNALLVNVLKSRGNSKTFLHIEIYKKIIAFSNLSIGFLYGIEGYLYGLIFVVIINTSINGKAAARECRLSVFDFLKPVVTQWALAVIAVMATLNFVELVYTPDIRVLMMIIKGLLFVFIYLLLNWVFKTSSFVLIIEQIPPSFSKAFNLNKILFFKKKPKVFLIGQENTRTASLASVLKAMGYKIGNQVKADTLLNEWAKRDFRALIKLCKTADAFQDVPFNNDFTYSALDSAFPNSKFILTVRKNKDEWYNSVVNFHIKTIGKGTVPTAEELKEFSFRNEFKGYLWQSQKMIYGVNEATLHDYKIYTNHYENHNARVKEYFKYRPNDLLVIDLAEEDVMEKIHHFLGVKYNDRKLPNINKLEMKYS